MSVREQVRPLQDESRLQGIIAAMNGTGPLSEERASPEPNEGNYVVLRDLAFVLFKVIESGRFHLCSEKTKIIFDGLHMPRNRHAFKSALFNYLGKGTLILPDEGGVKIFDLAPDLLLATNDSHKRQGSYTSELKAFAKDCMAQYGIQRYSEASLKRQGAHEFVELDVATREEYFDQVWKNEIESYLYGRHVGPIRWSPPQHP